MAPSRKRKQGIEEIAFDQSARHDYLTGFHKSVYSYVPTGCTGRMVELTDFWNRETPAHKTCSRRSPEEGERGENCRAKEGTSPFSFPRFTPRYACIVVMKVMGQKLITFYNRNSYEMPGKMMSRNTLPKSKSSLEKLPLKPMAAPPRMKTGMASIPTPMMRKLEKEMSLQN